jgi:predicted RNA-binding Zn ribbon-like protein
MASAPGQLALVERFVNSEAATPEELGAWLAEHGLAEAGASWSAADAERAAELREGLRALLLANNGVAPDPAAVARVDVVARESPLAVSVDPAGLEPLGSGIAVPLARVLAIVARAQADGSWSRLKACQAEDCHWAFYDSSRNRSRTWCSMSVCGNRAKARAYRARR